MMMMLKGMGVTVRQMAPVIRNMWVPRIILGLSSHNHRRNFKSLAMANRWLGIWHEQALFHIIGGCSE